MRPPHGTQTLTTEHPQLISAVVCEVLDGRGVCGRYNLVPGTHVLGAADDCAVRLADATVSRRHAEISLDGGELRVKDLGSRNGTWYLGARISEAAIPLGSTVRFGKALVRFMPPGGTQSAPEEIAALEGLSGSSLAMRRLYAAVRRVAPSQTPVLLRGETGTGKEAVARALHAASDRASGPFVVFEGGRSNLELLDSELFGHAKGAFTGATAHRAGAAEQAHGGTLFLDEVGELPAAVQVRLLRVLETGSFSRMGEAKVRTSSFRLVSATHHDLDGLVKQRAFREDLYFRLAVVVLDVPALRERREDIPALARQFAREKGITIDRVTLATWLGLDWPGNVRELRNAVERLGSGVAPVQPSEVASRSELIGHVDRELIAQALERADYDVEKAAAAVGLSRSQLYRVMKRHGIAPRKRSK
jgi:DNA-binding NtrC family response regulator